MFTKTISAVTRYDLTTGSPASVSTVVVQVEGLTGSITPQLRIDMGGVGGTAPSYVDCAYLNQATQASVTAGTAITADGIYQFTTNGCLLSFNVTSVTGSFAIYVTPLEGPSSAVTGGTGGGAVTVADGADVNAGSTTDAANTTGTTGTISGKLRGLVTILADVWVSASHYLKVRVTDGTNNMPTADAVARALYARLTDGTTAVGVDASTQGLNVNLVKDSTTSSGSKSTVSQVSVATTATQILAANSSRKSLAITNQGASTIYLGNSGVTTSTGFALAAGATVSDVTTTDAWYGIVASGTVTAGVIEVS